MPDLPLPHAAPPTSPDIDATAAARWQRLPLPQSPWLHEEVARRMAQRLDLILRTPHTWLHWAPLKGGRHAHALLAQRYPHAQSWIWEPENPTTLHAWLQEHEASSANQYPSSPPSAWWMHLWQRMRSRTHHAQRSTDQRPRPAPQTSWPPAASIDLLWANMTLHTCAQPYALLQQWRQLLSAQGFVMFSALGAGSLEQLRHAYTQRGWLTPCHHLTDMHDWGDWLVQAGFADPVMDSETITLRFASPQRAVQELRELGRNLSPQRSHTTRGRAWLHELYTALEDSCSQHGAIELSFEIIYGHAMQSAPRHTVGSETHISLHDMRQLLHKPPAT